MVAKDLPAPAEAPTKKMQELTPVERMKHAVAASSPEGLKEAVLEGVKPEFDAWMRKIAQYGDDSDEAGLAKSDVEKAAQTV
jgi:hypothetical protein